MRTLDSDCGGYEQVHQPSLEIKKDKKTKFSDSKSKEAAKRNPSQSNFSAEISEQGMETAR